VIQSARLKEANNELPKAKKAITNKLKNLNDSQALELVEINPVVVAKVKRRSMLRGRT
jgi:hypothetical protein